MGTYTVDPSTGDVIPDSWKKPSAYDSFWGKAGPGLLDFGAGLYSKNAAEKEAAKRLAAARGPLYDQAMSGASGMLTQAGNFDPQAFATDRFNAQQALVAPKNEADFNALMRNLRAKGLLGVSSYAPALYDKGNSAVAPVAGQAMNPHIAAFYAAQNAQRSKDAYGALGEGQTYLDNLVKRAGMLSGQAAGVQRSGIEGQQTQPSRAAGNAELLKGGMKVLGDSGILKDVFKGAPGMIGSGIDWLGNTVGSWFKSSPDFSGSDFDIGSDFSFDWA